MKKLLIACEVSGAVRRAMRAKGHDAYSCDIQPSDDNSEHHLTGDVRLYLHHKWDGMICFPPCTDLASSGARWFPEKRADGRQQRAVEFALMLMNADIPEISMENPVGVLSSLFRKPDQIIQPWMFGHGETKATCLWLKNLQPLKPTNIVSGRESRIHHMSPGPNRAKLRSETYSGIANAMADQWFTT